MQAAAPSESSDESKQSSVVTETTFQSNRSVVPSGPAAGGALVDNSDALREKERKESFKDRLKKRKLDEDGSSSSVSSKPKGMYDQLLKKGI